MSAALRPLRADAGGVTFDILVQPRASRGRLGPWHDGRLKIAVTSPPLDGRGLPPAVNAAEGRRGSIDGEANAALIELLAKQLGVPRGAVAVVLGATSRRKTVRIAGIAAEAIRELVE